MKKKEIVVLDCGVEVRSEDAGVLFTSMDVGREFAFGIKSDEILDMISYLQTYAYNKSKTSIETQIGGPVNMPAKAEPTPVQKAAMAGVEAGYLRNPSEAKGGRSIPSSAVSVHKG